MEKGLPIPSANPSTHPKTQQREGAPRNWNYQKIKCFFFKKKLFFLFLFFSFFFFFLQMASRDLLEFHMGERGHDQLSLWNVHQVPLGIEAGPDPVRKKTQGCDGGGVQGPGRMDGAGPRMQESSQSPPKPQQAPPKK